ncbi:TolC family protein [Opitutus terrae]|uniref:Outer membrane efflux protein n=1 Tax=Opitutus terrae (strain DSM 11246 / JCM 15787 / PB90-1) TaxID=452637 RepID=B1ZWT2_OPITP|nr:TolC family protein [Opitutus terrae]ACB74209.1 outer membrane efflux protein [Opitutus terrae PB90-1]
MNRSVCLSLLTFGTATVLATAAEPALSLDDCLKLAAQQHPALAASHAGAAAAAEAVGEARAPYYPQVDLSAGYHRWQRRAFLPSGLALPGGGVPERVGPLDDWNAGVVSRVTLYDFGERRAGVEAAEARHGGAQADAAAVQADVRLGVRAAFYALAAAQELRAVAAKSLARAEAHRELARVRREAGAVPQADVLRTEADVADARLQVITADSRIRIATGQLNTAMGRPAETPLGIVAELPVETPPDSAALAAAAELALARRPEIESAAKRATAARAAVTAARASRAPKLRADGSFGWRDTAWVPDTREWQAGLSIDVPIFDAGSRARRVARSQAEAAREEAAMANRRLQIRDEVWAAGAELERAWAAIAAGEASRRAHEESLRLAQERYRNGAALIADLLDTQAALARAEAGVAEARWGYLRARAAFARAVGAEN